MNALLQTSITADSAPDTQLEPLLGKSLEELRALVRELDEPAFRADQLHQWIYVHCVRDFEQMTNLKKTFRDKLSARYQVGSLMVAEKQVSQDGTTKYLFRLPDGKVVESVLMFFEERGTYAVCLSTQVGCAVNCDFCATGKLGFKRNLSVSEIVEQYVYVQADSQQEVRNIVYMGQGEPMLNYDNLMQATHSLNKSAEVGMRHITISTSGIVPRIYDLAQADLQLTLAVSLHAPDNATREAIMPINRKWPLEELMPALHHYVDTTGKRLTIEYILLAGVNDQPSHAHDLGKLLQGLKCNVNLIPYNPIGDGYGYKRPSGNAIHRFKDILMTYGKKVTLRVERGVDIAAACGQLANKVQNA
jgi:23S rRNA (adenine2503-C2)-methyltransferase